MSKFLSSVLEMVQYVIVLRVFEFGVVGLDSGAARFRRCEEWCAMIERCWKMEKVETGEKKKKKKKGK